ncbi:tyrosine-type recombinase/integrase [Methylogaea oryzae]|uniref:tyrosine-type recombinase/integrase n=1 Tax=Methylogaea oryzae TaxID=1295382 RepID=UPI001C3F285A|nr:tyrosine-type recombinase/integrase [Methylogaea oryzae]
MLRAAINWAQRELEWDIPNPFGGGKLKKPAPRARWLTHAEAAALIRAAEKVPKARHLARLHKEGERIASIKKGFASAVKAAGLDDVHPHDLRRTFGSWLVQAGVPIQAVSSLLRHSDIRITDRVYAHLSPVTLKSAVDVLDGNVISRCPKKAKAPAERGF